MAFSSRTTPSLAATKAMGCSPLRVSGSPIDGRFFHAGKLVNHFLDLARIDVDAVDQQHVFLAVGDVVIAFGVAVTDVAGQQPAVAHGFGGFRGLFPVAEHDVAAAHADLADFAGGQHACPASSWMLTSTLGMGRPMEPALRVPSQRVLGDDRAGFAQAVTFDERDVELGLELLEHLGGQRRRAADADAQGQAGRESGR